MSEQIAQPIANYERLVKNRGQFHIDVFKLLINMNLLVKDDPDASYKYSKIISEYIDNKDNLDIRTLIESDNQADNKRATEMMISEILRQRGENQDLKHAA